MSGQRENPLYHRASYLTSAHRLDQLPDDIGYEVAFAGRSNAGKSTAINAITNRKALARTSKTPGRTQQIVQFELDEERRFADLPGYGYAKVAKSMRQHWQKTLDLYFQQRVSLKGLVLIMDIRHPLRDFDRQLLAWSNRSSLPCHVLLTKADKMKRGPGVNAMQKIRKDMKNAALNASTQLFSGTRREGVIEVHGVLDEWMGLNAEASALKAGNEDA
jgi:GTP-binding protein